MSWATTRRRVLQAGTALGFAALGVFPSARKAYADGYDIYDGPCPSYASSHDCSPGCGPSTVYADSCETSGEHAGFHKNDGVMWTLRPNGCFGGTYDGWLWRYEAACGACGCYIERRCHDGYRRTSSGWVRSICRFNTDCGCPTTVTWPTVVRGERGPNVQSIQHLVTYHEFATNVDGIFGVDTEARVQDFQTSEGLTADGIVDAEVWALLVVTVRRGDSGEAVRAAQRQLNKLGLVITVDGTFSSSMETLVRSFQTSKGLTSDGVVGQNTWRILTGSA